MRKSHAWEEEGRLDVWESRGGNENLERLGYGVWMMKKKKKKMMAMLLMKMMKMVLHNGNLISGE